ncbi:MAG: TMEM175 family protein [Polyangiaceae bacterium]
MNKGRLEAFSDGVIAIILTITVLEIKLPHDADLTALEPVLPEILSYALSFVFIGTYWNNHHHMLAATRHINGWVMWANLHLLFWLSLIPAATAWLGEFPLASWPAAVYGFLLFMGAVAFKLLQKALIGANGQDSPLASAVGADAKGWFSQGLYVLGIALAFARPWMSEVLYVVVLLVWFMPDRRIEARSSVTPPSR